MEREILRGSYDYRTAWMNRNPGVNAIHTPNTLRERLLAYRARASLHTENIPVSSPDYIANRDIINTYNA